MAITYVQLRTVGEIKKALKGKKYLFVWCNWQREDGCYIRVLKKDFLTSIGADTPNDGAHGGIHDNTVAHARIEDDEVYVN